MKKIKKYYELIQCLDSKEWQVLKNYLTCFGSNHEAEKKIFRLAQLLRDSKDGLPPSFYAKQIYGEENLIALEQLCKRLKTRTLDILACDITCGNEEENADDADHVLIKLKRMCVHYQRLLYTKPEMEIKDDLLNEIISTAKEYEDYSTLIHHLHVKKQICQLRSDGKQVKTIESQIKQYEKCKAAVITGWDYIYELKSHEESSGKRDKKKRYLFFEKAIPHLKYLYSLTPVPYIKYHLNSLEVSRLMLDENFMKARSKALELLKTIRKNKSVYKKQRIGIVYDIIAMCEIHMRNFEHALEQARLSLHCFPQGHYNYVISKQYEFYSLFFLKQYDESEVCAREMMRYIGKEQAGDFRFEKFYFLHACALFKLKRYEEALAALAYKTEIKNDKEGWEFSWRILQIMIYIELESKDKASEQIKALYMFMYDNKTSHYFSLRQKMIGSLLSLAEKQGFYYSLIHKKAYSLLSKLENADKDYGWQILSSELIPFHKWAASKMKQGVKVLVG